MIDRRQRGQATVELALVLPVVVLILLATIQVAVVARAQLLVVHAAHVGARAAAIDDRPGAARSAVESSVFALKARDLTTETSHDGVVHDLVTVRVHYVVRTTVPLVGLLLPDVRLTSIATYRDESGQRSTPVRISQENQQERRHTTTKPASGG